MLAEMTWHVTCRFVTSFVTVFATVIAITKDLPDVEGDRRYNIDTLATRFGPRTIAFTGMYMLAGALHFKLFCTAIAVIPFHVCITLDVASNC